MTGAQPFNFDALAALEKARAKIDALQIATTATLLRTSQKSCKVADVAELADITLESQRSGVAKVATSPASISGSVSERVSYDAQDFETADLCSDVVPAIYRDAWMRLNRYRPLWLSEAAWLRALDDGARFLDTWGWVVESGWAWTANELFDNNGDDKLGGLVWRLQGRAVVSYGPDYARLHDDVVIWRAEVQEGK